MATNFPTGLDSLVNPTAGDKEDVVSHSAQHSNANDAIESIEATVGITNSTIPTSHDYRIKQVENKTVDASATVKGITKLSTTPVSASNPIALGENDTRVLTLVEKGYIPTSGQKEALAGTSGIPSSTNKYVTNDDTATSGANKVLRLDGNGKLPVLSGENLTNIPSSDKTVGTEINTNYQNHIIPFFRNPANSEMIGWIGGAGSNNEVSAGGYCFINANGGLISLITKIPGSISNEFTPADNKEIRIKTKLKLVDTGDIKAFGLTTSTAADIYSAQTAITNGLVRFVFNGTSLFANNSNGTAVTNTTITGITLTAWNTYEIVFIPGTSIAYYVNGVLVATHTTNLPTTGTQLLGLGVNTNGRQFFITPISISIKN